jgi:mannonate dehydratase
MPRLDRRSFVWGLAPVALVTATRWRDRLLNPCRGALPERLARHELVRAAWDGLDPADVWDCHVHLAGTGDSGEGPWMSPRMSS